MTDRRSVDHANIVKRKQAGTRQLLPKIGGQFCLPLRNYQQLVHKACNNYQQSHCPGKPAGASSIFRVLRLTTGARYSLAFRNLLWICVFSVSDYEK
jgi:hypothetical protein